MTDVQLDNLQRTKLLMSYLLVDTSYVVFYRYFATKQWYRRAHDYVDDETMIQDTIFTDMFVKKTKDCLAKIVKQYTIPWENIIFARDCPRNEIWRLELLPSYKGTRVCQKNCRTSFNQIRHIILELIRSHNVKSIGVSTAEADDVIAVCHKYLMASGQATNCYILASDTDYFQLLSEHTKLLRLDNRDPMKSFSGNAQEELLAKIIGGDVSDCIPKCFPNCGKKTSFNLAKNPDELSARLGESSEANKQFQLNQQLIDFNHIPLEIQEIIQIKLMVCLGIV